MSISQKWGKEWKLRREGEGKVERDRKGNKGKKEKEREKALVSGGKNAKGYLCLC